VSIGNGAFMAIGAFTAVGVAPYGGFLVGIVAGVVASGLAGLIIGIPSLRLRGFYLVLSTLALQQIVSFGFEQVQGATNTPAGYTLDLPKVGGYEISSDTDWLILAMCVLLIFLLATSLLERSRTGRAWKAIREHEPAASVIGINVSRYKLLAFVISSGMIGAEGVLLAYYSGVVDYHTYTLDLAVSYAAMVLIGGLGTLYGPVLGAILVTVIPVILKQIGSSGSSGSFLTKNSSSLNLLIYGVLIIVVLIAEPGGLAALFRRARTGVTALLGRTGGDR
jgi:branched-chain amino acid transport system permease protein